MDFKNSQYSLKLFQSCLPFKGAYKSIICDLDRFTYHEIPNSLFDLIKEFENKKFVEIYDQLPNNEDVLDEYFNFLNEHEYIILTETPELFPPIDTNWYNPYIIDNTIIDSNINSNHDFNIIFRQLENLFCKHVQLRFFSLITVEYIENIMNLLEGSTIISIEIVLPYSREIEDKHISLCEKFPRITNLIIFNSLSFSIQKFPHSVLTVSYVKDNITDAFHCGFVYKDMFAFSVAFYTESLNFNTCLNKKISIDVNGEIKNCPAMNRSYGNIKDTSLLEVAQNIEFQKVWHIHKDQIKICKDCEFRHICTDCRAFTEDPQDQYSKPLKCGYNPYTNEWEEWSTNPLKQKVIEYYKN